MSYMAGGNGHWVRTRNQAGAESFAKEMEMQAERRQDAAERSRKRREAVTRWLRRVWQRLPS